MWVLGNSMPLRPDFKVWVGETEVIPSLKKSGISKEIDFGDLDLKENLKSRWIKDGNLPEDLQFGFSRGLDKSEPNRAVPYVEFPNIGIVWGTIRLYVGSLLQSEDSVDEEGKKRSYGFFIMVLDRLINDRDAKLFLPEPSFATFYRAQYVLHIDGLNEDLLANREQIQRDTPRSVELIFLQKAVYAETVAWRDAIVKEDAINSAIEFRLPKESRALFIEPITALLKSRVADNEVPSNSFLNEPKVERKAMGEGEKLAEFSPNNDSLVVNVSHPYFKNLVSLVGNNSRTQSVIREIELLAISETLFEGFLLDIGLEENLVAEILDWRDKQYRVFANLNQDKFHVLLSNFEAAVSNRNVADFKAALIKLLKSIGFDAELVRNAGKDWIKIKTFGSDSYTVAFEIQSKKTLGPISQEVTAQSVISSAAKHVEDFETNLAVVIVGDITGFTEQEIPDMLSLCLSTSGVTLMNAANIQELASAMHRFYYDHASIKPIFTAVESPRAKLDKIGLLRLPAKDFDFNELIEFIIEEHKRFGMNVAFPFRNVYLRFYSQPKKDVVTGKVVPALDEKVFITKLRALASISEPHLTFDFKAMTVALGQAPERVRAAIATNLTEPEKDVLD